MSAVDKLMSYIHQLKPEQLDKEGIKANTDTKENLILEINKTISKLEVWKLRYILKFATKLSGSR